MHSAVGITGILISRDETYSISKHVYTRGRLDLEILLAKPAFVYVNIYIHFLS